MARFKTDKVVDNLREAADYLESHKDWDWRYKAVILRDWCDELDPPAMKCTAHDCDHDALFRAELPAEGDNPGMISFRCELHLVTWLVHNAGLGSIKVDLL